MYNTYPIPTAASRTAPWLRVTLWGWGKLLLLLLFLFIYFYFFYFNFLIFYFFHQHSEITVFMTPYAKIRPFEASYKTKGKKVPSLLRIAFDLTRIFQKFGFINGVDNVNWPPY